MTEVHQVTFAPVTVYGAPWWEGECLCGWYVLDDIASNVQDEIEQHLEDALG